MTQKIVMVPFLVVFYLFRSDIVAVLYVEEADKWHAPGGFVMEEPGNELYSREDSYKRCPNYIGEASMIFGFSLCRNKMINTSLSGASR